MTGVEEVAHYVHQEFLSIVEPLFTAFASASEEVNGYLPETLRSDEYRWLRTANLRACARRNLGEEVLDGWKVTGNRKMNGAFWLRNDSGDLKVRILRDGTPPRLHAPTAGAGRTRQAFWMNSALEDLPEATLFTQEVDHSLLLLWQEHADMSFSMRVLRPLGHGAYGREVAADLQLELSPVRLDFENLRFRQTDNDEDLLGRIAKDEQDEDGIGNAG